MNELTGEERAMIVAMEALRQSIVKLPEAIAANIADARGADGGAAMKARAAVVKPPPLPKTPEQAAEEERQKKLSAIHTKSRRAAEDKLLNKTPADEKREQKLGAIREKQQKSAEDELLKTPIQKLGAAITSFATIIGPFAILGTILGQTISGFQMFFTAIKVLATSIAPILLPVMVVLSAAIIAVADIIWQEMLPALEEWYGFVLSNLIPAVIELAEAFLEAAEWIAMQVESLDPERAAGDVARYLGLLSEESGKREGGTIDVIRQRISSFRGAMSSPESGGGGGFQKAFGKGMDDVIKSLKLQLSPKAQTQGLADVWKNAQMAALNADPIEMRQLKVSMDALNILQKQWHLQQERMRNRSKPAYATGTGAGDFAFLEGPSGGTNSVGGTGGDFGGDF